MQENVFRENTFMHNGHQQLPELVLPFGTMRCYPPAAAAFVLLMDNAVRHLMEVGNKKAVWIQIDIDRDPGNHAGLYGKVAQAGTARA